MKSSLYLRFSPEDDVTSSLKPLKCPDIERRALLLMIMLEKAFRIRNHDYMAYFFTIQDEIKDSAMRLTLATLKLNKVLNFDPLRDIKLAFYKIMQKNIEPVPSNLQETEDTDQHFNLFQELTINYHKDKVEAHISKLNQYNFEKYSFIRTALNKLNGFANRTALKHKNNAFYIIQYQVNPFSSSRYEEDRLDQLPQIEFQNLSNKKGLPRLDISEIESLSMFKKNLESNEINHSLELENTDTDTKHEKNHIRSLISIGEPPNSSLKKKAGVPKVPKLKTFQVNRKDTEDEIFDDFHNSRSGFLSREHSFIKDNAFDKSLKLGIETDIDISAIECPPPLKSSPMKESLKSLFLSKKRENFTRSISPRKNFQTERVCLTERTRDTEIKERLSKISKILNNPASFTQRKIEKYLRFEHSLFQIIRIWHGFERRVLLHAFESIQHFQASQIPVFEKHQNHLKKATLIASQRWRSAVVRYFYNWRRGCAVVESTLLSVKLLFKSVKANYQSKMKYALWRMKENVSLEEQNTMLEGKLRATSYFYRPLSTIVNRNKTTSMQQMFALFKKHKLKLDAIQKGLTTVINTMQRVIIKGIINKINIGRKLKSFRNLIRRKELLVAKDTLHTIAYYLLARESLEDKQKAAMKRLSKLFIQKLDGYMLIAMAAMNEQRNVFRMAEEKDDEALKQKKYVKFIQTLCSKLSSNVSSTFQRIKDHSEQRRFMIHSLFDKLNLIFTRQKVSTFMYIRTQTKLEAHYEDETDYFRHRLKNYISNTAVLKERSKAAGAKNMHDYIANVQRRLKTDCAKKIFERFRVLRIKEANSENTLVKPLLSIDHARNLIVTIGNIAKAIIMRNNAAIIERLKANVSQKYFELELDERDRTSDFFTIISTFAQKKRYNYLQHSFQMLINAQHHEAFNAQQKLLKLGSYINKYYFLKLQNAFHVWKTDLEICKAEWRIIKRLMAPRIYQEEKSLREIGDIIRQVKFILLQSLVYL